MKKCNNVHCTNNSDGYCSKASAGKSVYCLLSEDQWLRIREHQHSLVKNSKLPKDKPCKNLDCINNIDGYCFLISQVNALNFLTDQQLDELFS